MLSVLLEIHFWTFSKDISHISTDLGTFRFYHKKENEMHCALSKKKLFTIERGYQWSLSNKKPLKLRQYLEEFEHILHDHEIIRSQWLKDDVVILLLSSGLITYFAIDSSTGNLKSLYFDKTIMDKISLSHVSDMLLTNMFTICCHYEPQVTLIYCQKSIQSKFPKKLCDLEPRFLTVRLPGPTNYRLSRKLLINKSGDLFAVWWKCPSDLMFPWTPSVKNEDRANILVYHVDRLKVELICYYQTKHDIIDMNFSVSDSNRIHLLEELYSKNGERILQIGSFQILKFHPFQQCSLITIPLHSKVCCLEFSPDQSSLLVGCANCTVLLINLNRALTQVTQSAFIPSFIKWNPNGYVVAAGSSRGQIQCFDLSLGALKMQCVNEDVAPSNVVDLSKYFSESESKPRKLSRMEWNIKCPHSKNVFLLLSFSSGPITIVKIIGTEVLTLEYLSDQYIISNQIDKAINILLAMDWDISPGICWNLLNNITNHVLRSGLSTTPITKYTQIQMALSSFMFPVRPISHSVEAEYCKPVRNIGRRHNLYDLALNIASQLNEHDIFMDIYHSASNQQNLGFAALAEEKANNVLIARATNSSSGSSEQNDNSCSVWTSISSQTFVTNPQMCSGNMNNPAFSVKTSFANISRVNSSLPKNSSVHRYSAEIEPAMSLKNTDSGKQSGSFSCCITSIDQSLHHSLLNDQIISSQINIGEKEICDDKTDSQNHLFCSENKNNVSRTVKVIHFGVV